MVRWPAAEEAVAYARDSSLGVGLHLDLGEWEERDGEWQSVYEVVPEFTEEAVGQEIDRQLERFESLMGSPPTHLDSHQHVHNEDPVRTTVQRAAQRLGIPIRSLTPGISYVGFHGRDGKGEPLTDAISVEALVRIIEELPQGVTELGCHPAVDPDHPTAYAEERLQELQTLCDPRVAEAVDRCGVALRSFGGL
jgi:predicted glycoside hydrolase/deacetylase ChbG (UPF0249 family)